MNTLPDFGEGRTRAPSARRSFRMSAFQGEPVVYVIQSDGNEAMVSLESWELHRALGFSEHLSADSNGAAQRYPRHMVNDPRPLAGRPRAVSLARTLVAQGLVRAEMEGGEPAPAKGWIVRHANGDRLDCRDSNLVCVPANGARNGYRAVWNVRERWKLVRAGLDPNQVFAERRREAARKSSGALSQAPTRARAPDCSPHGAGRHALKVSRGVQPGASH